MSNITKCQKQQKAQITYWPKLQNIQSYKMSYITKCPKLQNAQSYKMNKVKNVQNYKLSKITKCPKLQNVTKLLGQDERPSTASSNWT